MHLLNSRFKTWDSNLDVFSLIKKCEPPNRRKAQQFLKHLWSFLLKFIMKQGSFLQSKCKLMGIITTVLISEENYKVKESKLPSLIKVVVRNNLNLEQRKYQYLDSNSIKNGNMEQIWHKTIKVSKTQQIKIKLIVIVYLESEKGPQVYLYFL